MNRKQRKSKIKKEEKRRKKNQKEIEGERVALAYHRFLLISKSPQSAELYIYTEGQPTPFMDYDLDLYQWQQ